MFNKFVLEITLEPCKSYCCFFNLLIQNGDVYTAAEILCKQTAKPEQDLLYFCDLFWNHDIVYTYLATC